MGGGENHHWIVENHSKVKLRHVEGVLTSASLLVRHHDAIEALPVVRKLSMHVHKAGHGMGALESPWGAEDVALICTKPRGLIDIVLRCPSRRHLRRPLSPPHTEPCDRDACSSGTKYPHMLPTMSADFALW